MFRGTTSEYRHNSRDIFQKALFLILAQIDGPTNGGNAPSAILKLILPFVRIGIGSYQKGNTSNDHDLLPYERQLRVRKASFDTL